MSNTFHISLSLAVFFLYVLVLRCDVIPKVPTSILSYRVGGPYRMNVQHKLKKLHISTLLQCPRNYFAEKINITSQMNLKEFSGPTYSNSYLIIWGMYIRCWATTAKEAAIQQHLLSNGFENKHVCTEKI
jgi:hypothetical protein